MLSWLNEKLPHGVYAGPVRSMLKDCADERTLYARVRRSVRRRLHLSGDEKSPKWLAELYQLAWVVVGVLLLGLCRVLPEPWARVPGVLALYRPAEIFLLAVTWVFVDESPLHGYRRSLVGYLVNLGEVVVAFAAAYLATGCARGVRVALYSSLRTLVTIGPVSTAEPPSSTIGGLLLASQIVISYFLLVVVIASVVGALDRRERVAGGPTTR